MNFHLGSYALIVKTDLSKNSFSKKRYQYMMDEKDLCILDFSTDDMDRGHVTFVKNAHLSTDIITRSTNEAVEFLLIDNYFVFFCSNVSYVVKYKRFFDQIAKGSEFKIIKHPFNEMVERHYNQIVLFINDTFNVGNVLSFEIDKLFGFKMIYEDEGETHILDYYTNGLIKFGMMKSEEHIRKIVKFIITFSEWIELKTKNAKTT